MHLNLPDHNFFLQHHQAFLRQDSSISSFNNCRTNFYPKLCTEFDEIPPGTLRLTEHQDWGTLTFLIQDDVAGLEAKLRDDTWIPVTPIPGGLLLNAGLMLEMWSGGRIHAAVRNLLRNSHLCSFRHLRKYKIYLHIISPTEFVSSQGHPTRTDRASFSFCSLIIMSRADPSSLKFQAGIPYIHKWPQARHL